MNLSQRLSQFYNSKKLPWVIICVGIVLRLVRYLHNPSLWFDELRNALAFLSRPLSDFFPFDPDMFITPPFGFVLAEKFAINTFGNSEYALKLFPLLSGIVSLFLFYYVAKNYIKPKAVLIALGLFSLLEPMIFYSSELRPYSTDVAITLLLYAVAIYVQSKKLTALRIICWGAIGAAAVWISHPAAIVLAGIGITLTISCLAGKEWARIKRMLFVFSFWFLSFLAVFFMYIRPLVASFDLTNQYRYFAERKAFMPLPPMSLGDIQWYLDVLFRIMNDPAGFTLSGIAAFTFLLGCISLYFKQKKNFFILISPLFIALLLSSFHKYTFVDRTILFLVPSIWLFVAEGAEYVRDKTSQHGPIIGITLIALLFLHPLAWSTYHSVKPHSPEEIKPVLSYVKDNWQEGDIVYVYYMSQFAFKYYSEYHPGNYHFNEDEYIIGKASEGWTANYIKEKFTGDYAKLNELMTQPYTEIFQEYVEDLNKLKGRKRIWVLFSSGVPKAGIHEEKFFIYHLETIGKKIDSFGRAGISAVYLYDLSGETLTVNE